MKNYILKLKVLDEIQYPLSHFNVSVLSFLSLTFLYTVDNREVRDVVDCEVCAFVMQYLDALLGENPTKVMFQHTGLVMRSREISLKANM